ncbi:MAG: hypothetical protein ACI3YC_07015 [Alloprevotella sp.]
MAGLLALTACSDDFEYTPAGAPTETSAMKFAEGNAITADLTLDDNSIQVTVVRAEADKAETVNIIATSLHKECFEIPSSVTFEKGETRAAVTINFTESMELFTKYQLTLALQTNEYAATSNNFITLTLSKNDYKTVCNGVYSCWLFGASWDSFLQYSEIRDDYRIGDWIESGFFMNFKWDRETNEITTEASYPTGYNHPSYGAITAKLIQIDAQGHTAVFDEEENTIYFGVQYVVSAGSFGANYDTFQITNWLE